MKKFVVTTIVLSGVIVWLIGFVSHLNQRQTKTELEQQQRQEQEAQETHQKALAIGLFQAPPLLEQRHVWISKHVYGEGRHGDVPMHIMFRRNVSEPWQLAGTGTKLGQKPDWVLTAYHVFEGRAGYYGCRKIGPNEFTGQEPIVPIVICNSSENADDAVVCCIDTNRPDFPLIAPPVATNMFRNWINDKQYPTTTWPVKIYLNTYPEQSIQNLLYIKMDSGASYFVFDWSIFPGESGTGAYIKGEHEDSYLVVTRWQIISQEVYDQLDQSTQKFLGWSPTKMYGIGNLIKVDPHLK